MWLNSATPEGTVAKISSNYLMLFFLKIQGWRTEGKKLYIHLEFDLVLLNNLMRLIKWAHFKMFLDLTNWLASKQCQHLI